MNKKAQQDLRPAAMELLSQLAQMGISPPSNLPPSELMNWAQSLQNVSQEGSELLQQLQELGVQQEQAAQQAEQIQTSLASTKGNKMHKIYNLKKAQGEHMPDPEIIGDALEERDEGLGQLPPMEEGVNRVILFRDGSEVRTWLNNLEVQADRTDTDPRILARNELMGAMGDVKQQDLVDLLNYFYTATTAQDKLEIASQIFDLLPPDFKIGEEGGIYMAPRVEAAVKETEETIKKLAKNFAKSNKTACKKFNMKKYAQQKDFDNTILYGPNQMYIDPFLMQPASRYSLLERQKGWGMNIGDIYDIDWEAVWRGNIMDKYSRAYKDKDGNWVGGYLQKRFEVNYNLPETNNMQLKPGQRRRPVLPEYGNTESRIEAARSKGEIPGEPQGKSDVFKWTTASTKKKI